jgi:opacity protein-like surface antigen
MKTFVIVLIFLFLCVPLAALDIINETSVLPAVFYDGEWYLSPNGFESGLRFSGSSTFDWTAALLAIFTASHGPGLALDAGLRYALFDEEAFDVDLSASLSVGLVYHVLGSGLETGYGARIKGSVFFPISDDYAFFLGLGLTWEFRLTTARWIGDLIIPLTAGFRYRL